MKNAIEINGVKKKYSKDYVLNGIDLVVPSHSICGFMWMQKTAMSYTVMLDRVVFFFYLCL